MRFLLAFLVLFFGLVGMASAATTTLSAGASVGNATTIFPGADATTTTSFLVQTDTGTDEMSAIEVVLGTSTPEVGVALVEVTSLDGLTVYGSTSTPLQSTSTITLTTPIPVTTTPSEYRVRVTPKSHVNMPSVPGALYQLYVSVNDWTGANTKEITGQTRRYVWVDNQSPASFQETEAWTSRTSAADNTWFSVTYGNGLFVAVAGSGTGNRVMTSPDGITWTSRTSAADNNWHSVTYGNGLFVAVSWDGTGNRVQTSPDGITWTSRTSAAEKSWYSVTYGNGLFVAVAYGSVMTSPDGITWTSRTSAADNQWQSVTYGNGLFVAVAWTGTGNRVMTSPDGITWTSRTSAADNQWQSVTYGNGLFVAVSDSGTGNRVMTSPDGITWTSRTSAADNDWTSVTYGNGLFVAVAYSGIGNRVMTSPDGITWTSRTSAANNYWFSVTYGNGLFVAVSNSGTGNRVMTSVFASSTLGNGEVTLLYRSSVDAGYSSSLVLFSTSSPVTDRPLDGATYTLGETIGSSTVGCIDTAGTPNAQRSCTVTGLTNDTPYYFAIFDKDVAGNYGIGVEVAGGAQIPDDMSVTLAPGTRVADTRIYPGWSATSTSAFSFVTSSGTTSIDSVTVSLGATPSIASDLALVEIVSADGATVYGSTTAPSTQTPTISLDMTPLVASSSLVEYHIRVTPRAQNETVSTPSQYTLATRVISWSGEGIHLGSDTSTTTVIFDNAPSVTPGVWRTSSTLGNNWWNTITYGNGRFVAVNDDISTNRARYSLDGETWINSSNNIGRAWSAVTYGDGLFVAVACGSTTSCNDTSASRVMTSPDGATWTARTTPGDTLRWSSVVYAPDLDLFAAVANTGTGNRVMTSPDGITWTSQTSAADNSWSSITYGEGLFVAVAVSGTGNRVMTSPDGITWTSRTSAADNQWRSVTYGNGIFVAVADFGNHRVMTSPDGIAWTLRNVPFANAWKSVTFADGIFVAVAYDASEGRVMMSSDGIRWEAFTSIPSGTWTSIAYGEGRIVTVRDPAVVNGGDFAAFATIPGWIVPGNGEVEVFYATPADTDHAQMLVLMSTGTPVVSSPVDGESYSVFDSVGSATVVCVDTATPPATTSSCVVSGLTNGESYHFALFAGDLGLNYSATSTLYSSPATPGEFTVSFDTGTQIPDVTIAPGATATTSGTFTVVTSAGTTTIDSLTLSLGSGATTSLALVEIVSDDGATVYGSIADPSNTTETIMLDTTVLVASSTPVQYRVRVTPKSHAAMPSPPGASYAIETQIVSWVSDGVHQGSGYANIVTVENLSASFDEWTSRTSAADNTWLSVTYGNGLFVAVACGVNSTSCNTTAGNRVMTSPDGITWTSRTSAANNYWLSVTYGNGLFVAVSYNGTGNRVMTSPDGITWTARTSAADNSWYSVTYGNGLFVAVACGVNSTSCNTTAGNRVMTSPDGVTWTARTAAVNNYWRSVTYGNGLFVAVADTGTGNRVMTSPDGITWTSRTSAADNEWNSVTYGNGLFVAVADTGTGNRVQTSPDGITWTLRTSAANNSWYSVTYGNGLFVAVARSGTGNRVMTSPDGITWTSRTSAADKYWTSVTYGNGLFVAVSYDGTGNRVMTLTTPVLDLGDQSATISYLTPSYTDYHSTLALYSATPITTAPTEGATYAASDTIGSATVGCVDDAGVSATSSSCTISGLTNGTMYYFAVVTRDQYGNYSPLLTPFGSPNQPAEFTTTLSSGTLEPFVGTLAPGDSATTSSAFVFTTSSSTDSITAIQIELAFGGHDAISLIEVVSDDLNTVYGSTTNPSSSSVDITLDTPLPVGTTPTQFRLRITPKDHTAMPASSEIYQIISSVSGWGGDGIKAGSDLSYRVVEVDNQEPSSPLWMMQSNPANGSINAVVYGGGKFVAVGDNIVMTSSDGIEWTSSPVAGSWWQVTYGGGVYVATSWECGGYDIMTSPDGVDWTAVIVPSDFCTVGVSYENGMFIVLSDWGSGADLMTSPDGVNWTRRTTPNDPWSPWLIDVAYGEGVFVAVPYSGQVITSPDGITWTARTSAADNSWSSITYGNGLFVAVACGVNSTSCNTTAGNRVMTSPDGITWTSRTSAADNEWNSVTYGNGLFVAVADTGTGNRVMTSPDGITWTSGTSAEDKSWQSVTYAADLGMFVAVSWDNSGSDIMTARVLPNVAFDSGDATVSYDTPTDADYHSTLTLYSATPIASVPTEGATYVASDTIGSATVGCVDTPGAATSSSCVVAGASASTYFKIFHRDTYGNYSVGIAPAGSGEEEGPALPEGYLGVSGILYESDRATPYATSSTVKLVVATSTTPMVWSTTTMATTGEFSFAVDAGEVATGTPLTLFVDNDASVKAVTVTRTSGSATITDFPLYKDHVTIRNESEASVGTTTKASDLFAYDSSDDSDVQFTASSSLGRLTVAAGQTLYVASSTTFLMDLPIEGHHFETATTATAIASSTIALTGNYHNAGTLQTATTSATIWTSRTAAADNGWTSVTYGNGLFVAVSYNGTGNRVMTSPDGITWTSRTSAADNWWNSVAYGNGLFVAVAYDAVMTSPDGITWTSRTSAADNAWQSVTYGGGLFVAVAVSGTGNRVMTSPDGITWTSRTSAADNDWISVTYGNGLFVAVSYNGTGNRVMTSPDGITWTSRTSAADNLWNSVTYGNGLFVAVSSDGTGNRVMTSPDGITWTSRTSAADNDWISVTYGNGLFVAVSYNGTGNRVMTSLDGITWTARTAAADNDWLSVTCGNGLFVAVADSGTGNRVMTSTESRPLFLTGATAQTLSGTMVGTSTLPSLIFQNAGTKTFSNNASTTDLTIDTTSGTVTAPSTLSLSGNLVNASTFVAPTDLFLNGTGNQTATGTFTGTSAFQNLTLTGSGQKIFTTTASTSKMTINSGVDFVSPPILSVSADYTNNGVSSYSANQWTSRTSVADNQWNSVAYGNGLFVAVAYDAVMTSPDGITWTSRTSAADNNWLSITYGGGLFVAVAVSGTGNRVMTSPDGITWTSRTSAADNNWYSVTYGNGLFVAVAYSGIGNRVMTSPDGITWTTRTSAANNDWYSVTYGNGLFVAVAGSGTGNRVMTSPDGITWTARTSAADNSWNSVTYGNGLFVAVAGDGTGNRVMTSPDGITWTSRTSAADNAWSSVTYGNGLFVTVAYGDGDWNPTMTGVMTSPDGITWTLRSSAADNSWNSVTYGNGLFVAVSGDGTGNRVMTSAPATLIFASSSLQTISGNLTGSSAFGNVITSGTGEKTFTSAASTANLTITSSATTTFQGALSVLGDLTASTSNAVLVLPSSATSTIYGTTTISGAPDAHVFLRATTPDTQAGLKLYGAYAIQYADIKDSFGSSTEGDIMCINCINSGNTIGWNFSGLATGDALTVSGMLYESDRTTPITTPTTLTIAVATSTVSTYSTTTESGTGTFTFSIEVGEVATGTPLTLFVDNDASVKAVTVTRTSGSVTITNFPLYQDHVTIRNESEASVGTTTKASDLFAYDSTDDSDVQFTASSTLGRLTVASGQTLYVASSTTFHMDMPIEGHSFETATTAVAVASSTIALTGNYHNAGSLQTAGTSSTVWTLRTSAANNSWQSVTYGNGLFVAVSSSGTGNRVMTSPDGITWTARTSAADNAWRSVTYGNGLFVAVACGVNSSFCNATAGNRVMTSPDGITWTARTAAADNYWNSVTYGNGLFVAVSTTGTGNRVMTSPDGITWTSRTSAANNSWNSVTYGNGLFVAVAGSGTGNRVMTSPDGITWTSRTSAANNEWSSVTYGNGLFVAVSYSGGSSNNIMTSPDGITWVGRNIQEEGVSAFQDNRIFSIAYGRGLFVVLSDASDYNPIKNSIFVSSDGITWTMRSTSNPFSGSSVTYGNGLFVVVSWDGTVLTSPESHTLSLIGAAPQSLSGNMVGDSSLPSLRTFGAGPKTFFDNASTTDFSISSSSGNVIFPSQITLTGNYTNNAIAIAPEDFYFTGAYQTATGSWSGAPNLTLGGSGIKIFASPATSTNVLISNGVEFVPPMQLTTLGSYMNSGTTSSAAGLWTPRYSAFASKNANSVTYGGGLFVAVAQSGTGNRVMTSPDGITWTSRTSAADNSWYSVTYGNGLFVAVACGVNSTTCNTTSGNRVMTSSDGITWTSRTSAANNEWSSVTYGNGLFVAVANSGTGNRVMTSPDGITWTSRTSAANNYWSSVTYGNGLFVAVAQYCSGNCVMTSPDGITWTARTSAADNNWHSVTYGNGLFVAVSDHMSGTINNRVMTSPDGITWTARTAAADNSWHSVTYGNGLFVAVANWGTAQRIMTSFDGSSWELHDQETSMEWWNSITYGNGTFIAVSNGRDYSAGTGVMTSNMNTANFSGASAQNVAGNLTGASAFGHVVFSGAGEKTFANNASTSNFTIAATSTEVNAPTQLSIRGSYENNGTFTANGGQVAILTESGEVKNLSGNLNTNNVSTSAFHDLTIAGEGSVRPLAPLQTTGDFVVNASSTFIASSSLAVAGDFTQNGTFRTGDASSTSWILSNSAVPYSDWQSVTYGNGLFVAVSSSGTGNRVMTSPDGITWTSRTSAADNWWTSVTYGNGLFVAVGYNAVMTSPDGITWTARTSAAGNDWKSVTYGNGLFVAVSYDGTGNRVMTSPDGITWTTRTSAADNSWNSVTYGNGLFVAVAHSGTGNRVMTSPDGITWTTRTSAADNSWNSVTYGNGLFVAVAYDSVMTSPDGITWTSRTSAADNEWWSVTYGNGLFVAVAQWAGVNGVMTSPDGITWTARTAAADYEEWNSVTYGNGLFVAVAAWIESGVMISPESASFNLAFTGITAQTLSGSMVGTSTLPSLIFQNAGTKIFTANASTTNLTIATTSGTVTASGTLSLAGNFENNATFVAPATLSFSGMNDQTATGSWSGAPHLTLSGSDQKTFTTPATTTNVTVTSGVTFNAPSTLTVQGDYMNNGVAGGMASHWIARTSAANNQWTSVTYGGGLFVAVGRSGTGNRVMTSPDGITWTARTSAANNQWTSVTYGNGLFVAVSLDGTGNRVMTSPDGITWTSRTSAADNQWDSVIYGGGLFVAVAQSGTGNRVMTSPDGITWTSRTSAANNYWESVTYGNGLFVAVSNNSSGSVDNRVMTSPDGVTWTSRTAAANNDWYSVTYGNGLFVAVSDSGSGSVDNRVMTSPDGITWTARTAADNYWSSVTYGGDLFVAVTTGAIMTSPDGIIWTSRTAAADNDWLSVTYGNGLFVAVSYDGTGNRVMTSEPSTIIFASSSPQTISGNLTGSSAFGNVITSGTGEKTFTSSASTTNLSITSSATTSFQGALSVLDTLSALPGARIAFATTSTTTVGTLSLSGTESEPVSIFSTDPGMMANFKLTDSVSASYVRIKDNSACGSTGGFIDVSSGFNTSDGNTECWVFDANAPTLSSASDHLFLVGGADVTLPALTIVDATTSPHIVAMHDIRITIATTTTNFRFDDSVGMLSFGGSAAGKVSSSVMYENGGATLVLNVTTNFAAGDTLIVNGIKAGDFAAVSTTSSRLMLHVAGNAWGTPIRLDTRTVSIVGSLTLANHSTGQTPNQFSATNGEDETLFAFRMIPFGEEMTIADLVLALRGVQQIDASRVSDLKLYRDMNSDRLFDAGDVLVDAAGILTVNGQFGAVTFSADFVATTTNDYIVTGDTANITNGTAVFWTLPVAGVSAAGNTSSHAPLFFGEVTAIQHYLHNYGAGGLNSRIGPPAPPGGSIETGGDSDGGGDRIPLFTEGNNIIAEPGFMKPSTTGTPDNEWANPENVYASDGVAASAASAGLRQSYGGFGFGIPSNNTIKGISVKIDASATTTAAGVIDIALSWNAGASYSTAKATPTLQGSDLVYLVGSETDTWGRTWAPAEFTTENFRLRITASPSENTILVDALEVRVYQQVSGGGSGGGGGRI